MYGLWERGQRVVSGTNLQQFWEQNGHWSLQTAGVPGW